MTRDEKLKLWNDMQRKFDAKRNAQSSGPSLGFIRKQRRDLSATNRTPQKTEHRKGKCHKVSGGYVQLTYNW